MDDFERFCQIAQPQVPHSELMPPMMLSRNRASSLRDTSRRNSKSNGSHKGSMEHMTRRNINPHETSSTLSPPKQMYENYDRRAHLEQSSFTSRSPFNTSPNPYCFRDLRRGSSPNPTIITYSHNPSPQKIDQCSPDAQEAGFNSSSRSSIVRVRSFRRTKGGALIDKGDRDITVENGLYDAQGNDSVNSLSPRQSLSGRGARIDDLVGQRSGTEFEIVPNQRSRSNSKYEYPLYEVQQELPPQLKVQIIGAEQVGKTMLVQQFLQSESVDENIVESIENQDELQVRMLRVEVDRVKTDLLLLDTTIRTLDEIEVNVMESADAYVIVYSVDDRASFMLAQQLMTVILGQSKRSSALILVANKNDLARTRIISREDGRNLAEVYSCEFFEISVALNHHVNELLVGLISAIEEGQERVDRERDRLAIRMASISMGANENAGGRRTSIINQFNAIKHSYGGNAVTKFFKKHFTS